MFLETVIFPLLVYFIGHLLNDQATFLAEFHVRQKTSKTELLIYAHFRLAEKQAIIFDKQAI